MKKISLLLALVIVAACKSQKNDSTIEKQTDIETITSDAKLIDTVWNLKEINNQSIVLDSNFPSYPKLTFHKESSLNGNLGCNNFNANYLITDNTITIKQIFSTQMACPNLEIEQKFTEVLNETKSFEIIKNTLLLKNIEQKIIAKLEAQ